LSNIYDRNTDVYININDTKKGNKIRFEGTPQTSVHIDNK